MGDAPRDAEEGPDAIESSIEERLEELREDSPAERKLLARAIGGWRGIVDSGLPSAVFVIVYSFNGHALAPAVWSAVAVGALIAVLRLIRREDLTQIAGGFAGILVSAFVASRTGAAEDFFLPGLLVNLAYGSAALLSVLVGWPLLGFLLGGMGGSLTAWRSDKQLRRTYAAATWLWVGVFGLRLLVQVPLYLAGQAAALGVVKIVMGWPLFLLGAWLTFLVVRPTLQGRRDASAAPDDAAPDQDSSADSSTSSSPS